MKIVVTGGSGRLGSVLMPELANHGHDVSVCDLTPPAGPYRYMHADVLNPGDLNWAFTGAEIVIHLAAIANPYHDPPERVFGVNMQSTYNVLEAAVRTGVRRVVTASSDSALGLVFRTKEWVPDYLPLDEDHPKRPQDAYGLSKAFAEDLAAAFTQRRGLQTIVLRPCWILFPGRDDGYRAAINDSRIFWKQMWIYVDARDCARAFRLAAEQPNLPDHAVFYVSAADLAAREETLALIDRFYPNVARVDRTLLQGHRTIINDKRQAETLGFRPQYSWREWLG